MSGRRVWRTFLDKLFPLRRKGSSEKRPDAGLRPRVEALEDRMAPAVLGMSLAGAYVAGGALLQTGSNPPSIVSQSLPGVGGKAAVPAIVTQPSVNASSHPVGTTSQVTVSPIIGLRGVPGVITAFAEPPSPGASGGGGASGASGSSSGGVGGITSGSWSFTSGSSVSTSGSGGTAAGMPPVSSGTTGGGVYVPVGQVTLTGSPASPVGGKGLPGGPPISVLPATPGGMGTVGITGWSAAFSASAVVNASSDSGASSGVTSAASGSPQGGAVAMSGGIFLPQGSLMLGFAGAETPVVQLQSLVNQVAGASSTSPVADSSLAAGTQGLLASVSPTVSDTSTSAPGVTVSSDAGASAAGSEISVPSTTSTILTGVPATSGGASYALIISGGSNVQASGLTTEQPQIVSGTNDATESNSTSDVNQPDNATAAALPSTDGLPAAIQTFDLSVGVDT